MQKNNISIKEDGGNISFFENVFYWLWFYFNKINNPGRPPSHAACIFTSVVKELNVVFLAMLTLSVVKDTLLQVDTWMIILLFLFIVIYFVDERLYLKRFTEIKDRFSGLTKDSIQKKKRMFFIYLLITIISSMMIPWLYSSYVIK